MKAGKEETTCLLDVAEERSAKAFVQVPVKGLKYESPAQKPLMKDGKGDAACSREERAVSM